jgi:hypothetical protein
VDTLLQGGGYPFSRVVDTLLQGGGHPAPGRWTPCSRAVDTLLQGGGYPAPGRWTPYSRAVDTLFQTKCWISKAELVNLSQVVPWNVFLILTLTFLSFSHSFFSFVFLLYYLTKTLSTFSNIFFEIHFFWIFSK